MCMCVHCTSNQNLKARDFPFCLIYVSQKHKYWFYLTRFPSNGATRLKLDFGFICIEDGIFPVAPPALMRREVSAKFIFYKGHCLNSVSRKNRLDSNPNSLYSKWFHETPSKPITNALDVGNVGILK